MKMISKWMKSSYVTCSFFFFSFATLLVTLGYFSCVQCILCSNWFFKFYFVIMKGNHDRFLTFILWYYLNSISMCKHLHVCVCIQTFKNKNIVTNMNKTSWHNFLNREKEISDVNCIRLLTMNSSKDPIWDAIHRFPTTLMKCKAQWLYKYILHFNF